MKYRPNLPDVLSAAGRAAIDSAVHAAAIRFQSELAQMDDQGKLVIEIAQVAAANAVETFRSYCANELRLIALDEERRLLKARTEPPTWFVKP